jgi:hypothetical protein
MEHSVWTIYNSLHQPSDWRFFRTRKECQAEINRIFKGFPSIIKLGDIRPVKVEIKFDV